MVPLRTLGNGDVTAIGSMQNDNQSGVVFIYTRSNNNSPFKLATILTQPTPFSCSLFGAALALSSDGSRLLVTAPGLNNA